MSKKKGGYGLLAIISLLILAMGVAAVVVVYKFAKSIKEAILIPILKYGGWALIGVGAILVIACIIGQVKHNKANKDDEATPAPSESDETTIDADESVEKVRYIPSENVYQFVNMGDRQSTEEKFNEIAKMDKTQFVIYVARLFSRKGYQVKFTPVIDNYGIDLLVEKMGAIIAVGIIHANKVLCESDIKGVVEGSRHYPANNVMTLTNMYFDRTALEFAKKEKMSLVDRNILAEDFMS